MQSILVKPGGYWNFLTHDGVVYLAMNIEPIRIDCNAALIPAQMEGEECELEGYISARDGQIREPSDEPPAEVVQSGLVYLGQPNDPRPKPTSKRRPKKKP